MGILLIMVLLVAVMFCASFVAYKYAEDSYSDIALFVAVVGFAVSGTSAVSLFLAGFSFAAADYKANIINREFGTSYTSAEVFFAEDVISVIREIKRDRIELNGNILEKK